MLHETVDQRSVSNISKHKHIVSRNGNLCCLCCGSNEHLVISSSFHDPSRSNQYHKFIENHEKCNKIDTLVLSTSYEVGRIVNYDGCAWLLVQKLGNPFAPFLCGAHCMEFKVKKVSDTIMTTKEIENYTLSCG